MNSGKLSCRQSWAKSLIKLRERCNDYPYGVDFKWNRSAEPLLKPGEFRNPNIPVEKIMSIRVEVFGNVLEYTVPANATSVKDGDTEIYLRRDDLETKLKSQVDSYRIMFESVNKQKQLYEKYNDLFQSVKGNSQENVTEEKYKELIARIAELEEQLKEKEQPKE